MRNELKYHFLKKDILKIKFEILRHNFFKSYDDRFVNSLYFDDINLNSFYDNIEGNLSREKVRARWYNDLKNEEFLFIEKKIKNNMLGKKLKHKVNIQKQKKLSDKFVKFINYEVNQLYNSRLNPLLITSYSREYYENLTGVRLTIDKNLKFINPKSFEFKEFKYFILEIKFPTNFQPNLSFLDKTNTLYTKNSKYSNGIERLYFKN